ncbi:MAG: hypothetical protein MJZ32_01020 [Bacteroidaceae bacterium]|nr:hypothetical protein [Bacteroidaceae bacterium]
MKELTKSQTYIFLSGGIMMVIGALANLAADIPVIIPTESAEIWHKTGACIFLVGAICFALMQILQKYEGNDITLNRIRKIQIIGDIAFILAGIFLMEKTFRFAYPFFCGSIEQLNFYAQYINNNWIVFLLIAAILEVYTTHRIANLIKKS